MKPQQIKTLQTGSKTFEADLLQAGIRRSDLMPIIQRAKAGKTPTKSELVILHAAWDVFAKLAAAGRAQGAIQ